MRKRYYETEKHAEKNSNGKEKVNRKKRAQAGGGKKNED